MSKMMLVTVAVVAVLGVGGGGYALKRHSDNNKAHEAFMMHEAAMKKEGAVQAADAMKSDNAMIKGGYISYADYSANLDKYKDFKVVLYFHAPWCPTCVALDKNINANLGTIPDNTVIVKTDYDSSSDLKKKYGVTYQHTMVQVDSKGNKIKKWSGSPELKYLLAEIQV